MSERRVCERAPYFGRVSIAAPPNSRPVAGRTFDISLTGVGIVCLSAPGFLKGMAIAVTFHLNHPRRGAVDETIGGSVAWLEADGGGCRIGVEFLVAVDSDSCPLLSDLIERI